MIEINGDHYSFGGLQNFYIEIRCKVRQAIGADLRYKTQVLIGRILRSSRTTQFFISFMMTVLYWLMDQKSQKSVVILRTKTFILTIILNSKEAIHSELIVEKTVVKNPAPINAAGFFI